MTGVNDRPEPEAGFEAPHPASAYEWAQSVGSPDFAEPAEPQAAVSPWAGQVVYYPMQPAEDEDAAEDADSAEHPFGAGDSEPASPVGVANDPAEVPAGETAPAAEYVGVTLPGESVGPGVVAGPAVTGGFTPPAAPYPVRYTFEALDSVEPDPTAQQRYLATLNAADQVLAADPNVQPVSAHDLAFARLSQDRFYQFKMWLQSPDGRHYTEWEHQAVQYLHAVGTLNVRWAAGWMSAEADLLRPIVGWLAAFDARTREQLTYADHNPAARYALQVGVPDSANPIPFEVLRTRLSARAQYQERLSADEQTWSERFGVPLGAGWQSSWAPGADDPLLVAGHLRTLIGHVTDRLWSVDQLPQVPEVPQFAPQVSAVPDRLAALMAEIIRVAGGTAVAVADLPEPFVPPAQPAPLAPGPVRWLRGQFTPGRAVTVSARQQWAEGVALDAASPTLVQRYDGSLGQFTPSDIRGAR